MIFALIFPGDIVFHLAFELFKWVTFNRNVKCYTFENVWCRLLSRMIKDGTKSPLLPDGVVHCTLCLSNGANKYFLLYYQWLIWWIIAFSCQNSAFQCLTVTGNCSFPHAWNECCAFTCVTWYILLNHTWTLCWMTDRTASVVQWHSNWQA